MTYSRRNVAEEREEAQQKAKELTALCAQFSISLDPIDWQNDGIRAPIMVSNVKIAELADLSRMDSTSILRIVQMKLFELAALKTVHAWPELKASRWIPVEVIQPQEFLSLWVVVLENDERIAIAEYLKNGRRVYEPFSFDMHDQQKLNSLFGPIYRGEYSCGEVITFEEHGRQCRGEILYILQPGKSAPQSKQGSRGRHTMAGKVYTNETSARYVVACQDGFPHIINQWQIARNTNEE